MDLFFLTSSVFTSRGGAPSGLAAIPSPSPPCALRGLVVCPGEIAERPGVLFSLTDYK